MSKECAGGQDYRVLSPQAPTRGLSSLDPFQGCTGIDPLAAGSTELNRADRMQSAPFLLSNFLDFI